MRTKVNSFLLIQTAFIGDVILATGLIEKIYQYYPQTPIDFLVRKGNEEVLIGHPFIRKILVWDKKKTKLLHLLQLISQVRKSRYDVVINVHRFASSGLITALSRSKLKIGFTKNPLALFFSTRIVHAMDGSHEIERNHRLIEALTDSIPAKPKLYPSIADFKKIERLQTRKYICIAPTSVWFTKQYPLQKWIEFLISIKSKVERIYLLGASTDKLFCESIRLTAANDAVINLAGKLTLLQSAALMQGAEMNFVNDSAPTHLASAMNAPVTTLFCSTVPSFGFTPLSTRSHIIETKENLTCRPCGLHGFKSCPQQHFKCATTISTQELVEVVNTPSI